jgi:hypothetical protein
MKIQFLKTAIVILIMFLVKTKSYAQGDMQFNQVINKDLHNGAAPTPYTVPAGKVFKLESVNNQGNSSGIFLVNNKTYLQVYYTSTAGWSNNSGFFMWPFPQWFSAGTVLSSTNFGGSGNYGAYITGIEFNIIP